MSFITHPRGPFACPSHLLPSPKWLSQPPATPPSLCLSPRPHLALMSLSAPRTPHPNPSRSFLLELAFIPSPSPPSPPILSHVVSHARPDMTRSQHMHARISSLGWVCCGAIAMKARWHGDKGKTADKAKQRIKFSFHKLLVPPVLDHRRRRKSGRVAWGWQTWRTCKKNAPKSRPSVA